MGQQSRSIFDISFAAAPIAVTQFRGVDFTGAQISVAGAKCAGIAKRGAAIGQSFEATTLGSAICEAGAAITVGQPLAMDALGRVVPASSLAAAAPAIGTLAAAVGTLVVAAGAVAMTGAVVNGAGSITGVPALSGTVAAPALSGGVLPQWIVGDALEAAAAAGSFIEVLLSR